MRYRTAIKAFSALMAVLLLATLCLERGQTPVLASGSDDVRAIAEAIDRLPVVGSVLFTGAHPDDENSALLPYLTHALHLRTAYLSATRGDGGQNLLGNEQYEALGLLRTEELLAARRVDGAQQFFTQAYDFGFSKSPDETMQKWGHEEVLGDFVRIIRTYRPDIVVSRFGGTSADGHGHHQAAGLLTREAFRVAADPKRYPEQIQEGLKPWQASKLFVNLFGPRGAAAAAPSPDTINISLDKFDPTYGQTYGEIVEEARSRHRSQGMGSARYPGFLFAAFRLDDSVPANPKPVQTLFDGVDLTLNRFTALTGGSPEVARRVQEILKAIQTARQELSPYRPNAVLPALAQGLRLLREVRSEIEHSQAPEDSKDQALFLLALKESEFVRAIGMAGGVRIDALADRAEIVPGETFTITVTGVLHSPEQLKPGDVSLKGPIGWKVERLNPPTPTPGPTGAVEGKFRVTVPPDAPVSQPYWLTKPRTKDYFPAPHVPWVGAPENPALFKGSLQYSVVGEGGTVDVEQESDAVYRFADRIYGERLTPLAVVPPVGVWMEPEVSVFPLGSAATQVLQVRVRNNKPSKQQGEVRLNLPAGWRSNPPKKSFDLAGRGDEVSVQFEISAPSTPPREKEHLVPAVAEVEGRSYSTGYEVVDYPHIQTRYWFRPAVSKLTRFDVKVAPGLKVGYVMGPGDSVPEALKLLGVAVEQLGPDDLSFGNLGKFDAIVTGIRAYEVRKDLVTNHARLMEYVRNGGLMIVQYSRAAGASSGPLGPYPMSQTSNTRVSKEEAPVEILEPVDPFFQEPNRITDEDFKGWVQERGLYFMDTWAPDYRPLLSSHDPGEPPQNGGMLLASYGKGLYLYTAYVWSRQLPAGVPGAYRLLANMISLGKTAAVSSPQPSQPLPRQR